MPPGNETLLSATVEKQLEGPMPWIGMYVAAASLICTLAMATDAFHGFRSKKYWLPSKYFSLNATSLTLLAVSMKLPVDLTTRMYADMDRLAKVSSMLFMSTAIGNFITCLGTMEDKEILMNVTALGILVFTVIVNVCVQIIQMRHFLSGRKFFAEEIVASVSMLLLLATMVSSAVMVQDMKKYLQSKYSEMLKMASDEQQMESMEEGDLTFNKLRLMLQKHWVMAQTSSPQFVITRSVTCTASGVICVLAALVLVQAEFRLVFVYKTCKQSTSKYGWSVRWILLSQSVGVVVGTTAPALRFFTAMKLKCCKKGKWRVADEFNVEAYWTRKLIEWKESSLPLQIRNRKWRRILHNAKGLILSLLVGVQILTVWSSKGVQFISFCIASPIFSLFNCIFHRLKNVLIFGPVRVHVSPESASATDSDLSNYVLLFEGESELPKKIQVSIINEIDKLIETGKKQQPKNLISLLHKIGNFKVLREVNRSQVPSLHSQEPPKCWSLPLVTLTSIAIALPNIPKKEISWLLQSVDEGLFYVKLIEKAMDKNRNLAKSRNSADVSWVGVELYRRWLDNDLHETSLHGKNSMETLKELSSKAERTIVEFKKDAKDSLMENPLNWPVKVIAANSMYRICQRLLRAYEGDFLRMDEGLFPQICNMIANIMAACLTNLMSVILMKCHQKRIKDKEKCVREAAHLLGEGEEILQILQMHRGIRSDPHESELIGKWCNLVDKSL